MNLLSRLLRVLLAIPVICLFPRQAAAQVVSWGGANGNWNVGTGWSGGVVPGSGTNAIIDTGTANLPVSVTGTAKNLTVGNSGTGAVTISGGSLGDANATLGSGTGSLGTGTMSGGVWVSSGTFILGGSGTGILNMSGGKVTDGVAYIGYSAGSAGTAALGSGTWITTGSFIVGGSGAGTLNITSGSISDGALSIGDSAASSGSAGISSGIWNTSVIYTGNSGAGTLTINNATVSSNDGFIGNNAGSNGVVNAASGTWSDVNTINVGQSGTGALNITGGYITDGTGYIGTGTGSFGTTTISSGTWHSGFLFYLGYSGTGVLNMSGGVVNSPYGFYVGYNPGSSGTWNYSGGSGGSQYVYLGYSGSSNGALNITSGSWASGNNGFYDGYSGTGSITINGGILGNGASIGTNAGSNGSATLTSGTWFMGNPTYVGQAGSGTLTINGGYASGVATIAASKGSTGVVNISSGTLSGAVNIGQNGTGTLNLTDTGVLDTGTGGTVWVGQSSGTGTLNIGTGGVAGTLIAGTVTLGDGGGGGTLNFNHTGTITFTQGISGVRVNQSGPGTTILTANSGYTGIVSISSGTLQIGNGGTTGALMQPGVNNFMGVGGGAYLVFDRSDTVSLGGHAGGAGTLEQIGTGELIVAGAGGFGGVIISSGSLQVGNDSYASNIGTGIVTDNGVLLLENVSDNYGRNYMSASITGTGSVVQLGNTTVMNGANSYTGTTGITGGVLEFANKVSFYNGNTASWTAANLTVQTGATAAFGVGGAGDFTASDLDTLMKLGNGTNGFKNGSAVGIDTTDGNLTYTGTIADNGANSLGLTKLGSGTLVLAGTSTYSGPTWVQAGTLEVDGLVSGTGAVTLGGTLQGTGTMNGPVSINYPGYLTSTGNLTLPGGINGNGVIGSGTITANLNAPGQITFAVNGVLNGNATIGSFSLFSGTGIITGTLTAPSNFVLSSASTLTVGSFVVTGNSNRFSTGTISAVNGTTLNPNSQMQVQGTLTGGVTIMGGALLVIGNNNAAGALGPGSVADSGTLQLNRSDAITLSNNISGTGAVEMTASGTAVLGAGYSYTGSTIVTGGVLQFGTGGAAGGTLAGNISNSAALAFNSSGTINAGGAITGAGALTQMGPGVTILGGSSSYTGFTTITQGTLRVTGSIASSGSVVISSGGTLAGSGVVGRISGAGMVAPGDPAILTASQVNPAGGMSYGFHFSGTGQPNYASAAASGNDVLHLTGATPLTAALTSANTIAVDFTGLVLQSGQIYYGGFFTDAAIANAMVQNATFSYTGLGGATVQFAGMTTVASAAFTTGTVSNGEVMEFDVMGAPVPAAPPWALLLAGAGLLAAGCSAGSRRRVTKL